MKRTSPLQPVGGFGLYVHWPYCTAKCPYCDFNSHVASTVDHSAWARALVAEIEAVADETGPRTLDSIFFGGGTPSLMAPKTVQAVIDTAQRVWRFDNAIEITLEANPGSVEAARFASYRLAGVNRTSLGIQALDDAALKALGRIHSVSEALAALDVATATFDRVSFDLIYARQFQSLDDWQAELERALSLGTRHLSLYQLTVEPETVFGRRHAARKLPGLPTDDLGADLYDLTQDLCEAAGLPQYETSNHAAPGEESRHNRIYWEGGDYVGIGPGAHGRLTLKGQRWATEAVRAPLSWLSKSLERPGSTTLKTPVSGAEQSVEYALMGLRMTQGIDLGRLVPGTLDDDAVSELVSDGMLVRTATRLRTTPAGRPLLNAILGRILA